MMFDRLFTFIDTVVTDDIGAMTGALVGAISPLLGALVILYALYIVYKSLYESDDLMVMESLKFIGSLALITSISISTPWYMANIVPFVLGAGDQIAGELLGGTGAASSLQSMFDNVFINVDRIWETFRFKIDSGPSWLDLIHRGVQSAFVFVGTAIFITMATGYLLIAKFMLGLLLVVGPLFIMMAFFPTSRSFFQSWTGQCFNNTLLTIMYPIAFSFFRATLEHTIFNMSPGFEASILTFIVFCALILLSVQIPTLCSTLSGGFGVSGINTQIGAGAKIAGSAGKGAYKGVGAVKNYQRDRLKGKIKAG